MNHWGDWIIDRKKAIGLYICRMCPSFAECKEEIGYCLAEKGMSARIKQEKGRLYPGCPGQAKEDFQHVFYCTRGSETGQSPAR